MEKIKLLLYCTKNKKQEDLLWTDDLKYFFLDGKYNRLIDDLPKYLLNGKIVAECDFEVEEIKPSTWNGKTERRILKESCLKEHQLFNYIIKSDENESQNPFYAIHIKNLHIFDKPRKIADLVLLNQYRKDLTGTQYNKVKVAPQNMCLVDYSADVVGKYKDHLFDSPYVLVSIKPEWLCKILNGEKTIEIRRKILKEMMPR